VVSEMCIIDIIVTDDIPSLRAIVNSYLRLVNTSYKCIVS
jgi:tRNA threonylcarbamoyladenosine modification (KEOPS) complex  Pcc1 subunit